MLEIEHKAHDIDNALITKRPIEVKIAHGEEILQDDEFSYEGYQVVRGEFFAHIREPSITFNNHKVSLNTACLSRLPNVDYVQILVNPREHKLVVRPSGEDEKDSFIWCSKGEKRRPKQVTCRVFFAKIMDLMSWNPEYRYKLLGKLVRSGNEYLFTFDLTAPEVYQKIVRDGEKALHSRTPVFPAEWQNQFGLPVDEHRKRLQVDIFKGYTIFRVKDSPSACPTTIVEELPVKEEQHEE